MKKDKCTICNKSNFRYVDFILPKSVTSDGKILNIGLNHLFCPNCGYIRIGFDVYFNYKNFYENSYSFLLDEKLEPYSNGKGYSTDFLNFFSKVLENNSKKNFIDIGAGTGKFLQIIYNKYPNLNYYALEPSKAFNKLKEKKFIKKSINNFFSSNLFSEQFDYLSLIGVLEHIVDPKIFLLEIRKIMKDNSFLLIVVPNFEYNKTDLLTIDHISKFTPLSIKNLFRICGFKIVYEEISRKIPMKFIIKKESNKKNFIDLIKRENNIKVYLKNSISYLKKVFNDAKLLNNKKIGVYGQGLILNFLIAVGYLKINNIVCVIDDNPLYFGKKFNQRVEIVNFEYFKKNYNVKDIFLAMNDCYHSNVLPKLKNYNIFGGFF